jgi:dipeptidase
LIHAITYSIIEHLRDKIPEVGGRVIWIYDGVTLTGREKPFITVAQLIDTSALLNAGRRDFAETYAFQIGIRARSTDERSRLSYKVAEELRTPIALYDTRGTSAVLTDKTFVIDVNTITPITVDAVENETDYHHAYIDAEVLIYRTNKDGLNFTQ